MNCFDPEKYLYHYTRFETACKILASRRLLFSKLNELNDTNESWRNIYQPLDSSEKLRWEDLSSHYMQLSFSETRNNAPGFLIGPMWGHYAEKGRGVCMAFDKERLLERVNGYWHGSISYKPEYNGEMNIESRDDLDSLRTEFFFTKNRQWEYEQEFRVVARDPSPDGMSIEGCIVAVIMFATGNDNSTFGTAEEKALSLLICKEKVLELGVFINDWNLRNRDGNQLWSKPIIEAIHC